MNLERVSPEEKVKLCRKYFYVGFFALPVVWLVNAMWFFKDAFINKDPPPMLRRYVIYSAIGSLAWIILMVSWISCYQSLRPDWGAFGDYISFNVPRGEL